VGAIAIVLGIVFEKMNVNYLVGWAFSVAASANLPSLVMLLFWKRTTKQGITAAILVGMTSSLGWILLSADTYKNVYGLPAEDALVPFSQPGIVTIPLGFLTLVLVSLLTPKPESRILPLRVVPALDQSGERRISGERFFAWPWSYHGLCNTRPFLTGESDSRSLLGLQKEY
jgi:Na+(H+)/acetate symporter ActP